MTITTMQARVRIDDLLEKHGYDITYDGEPLSDVEVRILAAIADEVAEIAHRAIQL